MRPGFRNPQSAIRNPQWFQPFSELEGKELAEEFADACAGVKITVAPRIVCFCFIVSMNSTIQGEFHKTRKRQNTAFGSFAANDVKQSAHNLRLARL